MSSFFLVSLQPQKDNNLKNYIYERKHDNKHESFGQLPEKVT